MTDIHSGSDPISGDIDSGKTAPAVRSDVDTATHIAGQNVALPAVRAATWEDLSAAINAGLADLRASPGISLGVGAVYALGGIAILWMLDAGAMAALAWPLMAGFALIGPFAAVIFYEISRRRERGEGFGWADASEMVRHTLQAQILYQGFAMMFWLAFWVHIAWMMWAVFFGVSFERFWDVADEIFTTSHGIAFLIVGHLSGAFFAAVAYAMSVVTFPYLLDRNADCVTAMIVSFRTVAASPVVMFAWAAMIGVAIAVASLPMFVGLVVVLPLLGHASWHLYRRLVAA
ncbi:MAG: DUF2189 domain-containing protein [Pseudomonadota bacterium]